MYDKSSRWTRSTVIATLAAALTLATATVAWAADLLSDALISSSSSLPTQVAGDDTFQIKVWATGNASAQSTTQIVTKYTWSSTTNRFEPSTAAGDKQTLNFAAGHYTVGNAGGLCAGPSGANALGCQHNPHVVTASIVVPAGTPGGSDGPLTVDLQQVVGSKVEVKAGSEDTGYVEYAPPAPQDDTAPEIGYALTPPSPDGQNGWYKGDVGLTWTVTELESPLASLSRTGCADQSITADQSPTTYSCEATSPGGSADRVDVTIKRDGTAPTIDADYRPADSNGWHNADVPVTFECSDDTSGIAKDSSDAEICGPDGTISSEGSDQTLTGETRDNAGNTASRPVTVDLDKTAPNAPSAAVSAGANAAGWHKATPVTVAFTHRGDAGTDNSGVDSCTDTATFNGETPAGGSTASGTCTDVAGNTSAATSRTVKIDTTAPVDVVTSLDSGPNADGWHNGSLSWRTTGTDALSGLPAGPCETGTYTGPDGTGLTVSGTCTDAADNSTADASDEFKYDNTAPVVQVTGVTGHQRYLFGQEPTAGCSTTDGTSGVKDHATAQRNGGAVGTVVVTCGGAKDNAGNAGATDSVSYSVVYDWNGFFAPVDNPSSGKMNGVKAGSAVPLKFTLGSNAGLNVFAFAPRSVAFDCGTTPVEPVETIPAGDLLFSNSGLSYDALSGQYTFVWKTDKSWANQCRQVIIGLNDGTQRTKAVNFKLTK